ncbi:response regulator [Alkalicoccus saliphilus]|jgi:two-component system, NarL family, response regulator LiaR|uniref:DNA-binding response regulator n=1 Tax=Alkalicoccus saliphilus TaxID=200989 RepID=A0A2T4U5J3_9BACI|nr:response regulator transcription factor [Alkalicoccus saliphilus]PTL38678.1 DNA-binding response regulator [Alkalicoccus saliphilus]
MIRVIFADDHEMVRIGVGAYLKAQPDIDVVAEAENGEEAVRLDREHEPDVVLMDLVMEPMDGIEATRRIMEARPEARVLIMTSFLDDEKVYPALEAGAFSYMLKTSRAADIAQAVRDTYAGKTVLEPAVAEKVMHRMRRPKEAPAHDSLTARELEVLRLMAEGKANQEIADELFIALKTVKVHVSSILMKLDVHDRTQAVIYALKQKLF